MSTFIIVFVDSRLEGLYCDKESLLPIEFCTFQDACDEADKILNEFWNDNPLDYGWGYYYVYKQWNKEDEEYEQYI